MLVRNIRRKPMYLGGAKVLPGETGEASPAEVSGYLGKYFEEVIQDDGLTGSDSESDELGRSGGRVASQDKSTKRTANPRKKRTYTKRKTST